jgi:hypothetical protein
VTGAPLDCAAVGHAPSLGTERLHSSWVAFAWESLGFRQNPRMYEEPPPGYTVEFASLGKGAVIELKKHARTYQRKRLGDERHSTPKVWSDRGIITFPGWPRDLVTAAMEYAFQRMGSGFRPPQFELRKSTDGELRHFEFEESAAPSEVVQTSQSGSGHETPPALAQGPTPARARSWTYPLLIEQSVADSLSDSPKELHDDISAFLKGLSSGSWESWGADGGTMSVWIEQDSRRALFTRDLPEVGTILWERANAIDMLAAVAPSGTLDAEAGRSAWRTPHIVLHEIRKSAPEGSDPLSFRDSFFVREPHVEVTQVSPTPTEVADFRYEYHVLSPSRIRELVEGLDPGLPLYLSEKQLGPFRSPGPVLLGGEAGSGKSSVVVLWLVINHIRSRVDAGKDDPPPRQLFVTYSPRLRDKARQDFEGLLPPQYKKHDTEFRTFRELLREICALAGRAGRFPSEKEVRFEDFVREFGPPHSPRQIDPVLLWDELRSVIKGGSLDDPSRFIDLPTYQGLSEKRGRCKTPVEVRGAYYAQAQKYQT